MTKHTGLTERQRYWATHIEAAERGGDSLKAYADAQGLDVQSLYRTKSHLRMKALRWMKTLFAIEHAVRDNEPAARYAVRQSRSKPVVEELRQWLDETLPAVPPKKG